MGGMFHPEICIFKPLETMTIKITMAGGGRQRNNKTVHGGANEEALNTLLKSFHTQADLKSLIPSNFTVDDGNHIINPLVYTDQDDTL